MSKTKHSLCNQYENSKTKIMLVLSSRLDRAPGDESRISFELTILHLAHPALIY